MTTATTHSVSQPLNLRGHVRTAPRFGFDFVPVLDLLVIAILFAVNGSGFIFAPGVEVELARTAHPELGGSVASAVLTVGRNDTLFFEGRKIAAGELAANLERFSESREGEGAVLLLKIDRSLELDAIFSLMDTARTAGFERVQLAAEEGENADLFQAAR